MVVVGHSAVHRYNISGVKGRGLHSYNKLDKAFAQAATGERGTALLGYGGVWITPKSSGVLCERGADRKRMFPLKIVEGPECK